MSIVSSGKVYYELVKWRQDHKVDNIAILTLEQIAPFPFETVQEMSKKYAKAELVWVQDEPENQGAWPFIALEVVKHLYGRTIRRVSRAAAASTATGSPKVHAAEQAEIMQKALTL